MGQCRGLCKILYVRGALNKILKTSWPNIENLSHEGTSAYAENSTGALSERYSEFSMRVITIANSDNVATNSGCVLLEFCDALGWCTVGNFDYECLEGVWVL